MKEENLFGRLVKNKFGLAILLITALIAGSMAGSTFYPFRERCIPGPGFMEEQHITRCFYWIQEITYYTDYSEEEFNDITENNIPWTWTTPCYCTRFIPEGYASALPRPYNIYYQDEKDCKL